MRHLLLATTLAAGTALMPAALAQTATTTLPVLPPGQSLGLALGLKTVPDQPRRDAQGSIYVGRCKASSDHKMA